MKSLYNIIRYFFLVKEIISKEGHVHFRRYRLLETPWLKIYIHQICRSDMEMDSHDHPWNFSSVILKGAYQEDSWYSPYFDKRNINTYYLGDVIEHNAADAHKLTLLSKEVWTLVFAYGRNRYWGYQTKAGWIGHKEYRQLKNEGKL